MINNPTDIYPFKQLDQSLKDFDYFENISLDEISDRFFYIFVSNKTVEYQEYLNEWLPQQNSTIVKDYVDRDDFVKDLEIINFFSSLKQFILCGFIINDKLKFLPIIYSFSKKYWIRSSFAELIFCKLSMVNDVINHSTQKFTHVPNFKDMTNHIFVAKFQEQDFNHIYVE